MTSITLTQLEEVGRCMPAHVTLREAMPMLRLVARLGSRPAAGFEVRDSEQQPSGTARGDQDAPAKAAHSDGVTAPVSADHENGKGPGVSEAPEGKSPEASAPAKERNFLWTGARDAELIRLRNSGATHAEIGEALGCTKKAAEQRTYKLRAQGRLKVADAPAAAPTPAPKLAVAAPAPEKPVAPPKAIPPSPPETEADLADRLAKAVTTAGTGISAFQQMTFVSLVLNGESPPVVAERLGLRAPALMARMSALFKASGLDPTRNRYELDRVMDALRLLAKREAAAEAA